MPADKEDEGVTAPWSTAWWHAAHDGDAHGSVRWPRPARRARPPV